MTDEQKIEQQLNEIKDRMTKIADPNLNNLDEALGGGLFGKDGVLPNIGRNFNNGSGIQAAKKEIDKASKILNATAKTMGDNQRLFDNLNDVKARINSLNIDQEVKKHYSNIIDAVIQTQRSIAKIAKDFASNKTAYDIATGRSQGEESQEAQPEVEPQQSYSQPEAQPEPEEEPAQEPAQEPQPDPEPEQTGAKIFNIDTAGPHISDWFGKQNIAEVVISESVLTEVMMESNFDKAFKTLYRYSDQMARTAQLGQMNPDAVVALMKLALAVIISKGKGQFENDVKDITNGFTIYKRAIKSLYKPQGDQATQQSPEAGNGQEEPKTAPNTDGESANKNRAGTAKELARKYLEEHGYEVTPQNIMAVAKYLMDNHIK
jgi:hypothetical protein